MWLAALLFLDELDLYYFFKKLLILFFISSFTFFSFRIYYSKFANSFSRGVTIFLSDYAKPIADIFESFNSYFLAFSTCYFSSRVYLRLL